MEFERASPVVGRYKCLDARVLAAINAALGDTNTVLVLNEPKNATLTDCKASSVRLTAATAREYCAAGTLRRSPVGPWEWSRRAINTSPIRRLAIAVGHVLRRLHGELARSRPAAEKDVTGNRQVKRTPLVGAVVRKSEATDLINRFDEDATCEARLAAGSLPK